MRNKLLLGILNGMLLAVFVTVDGNSAILENLDEVIARKARLQSATWGSTFLEGPSPTYYWQPETLNYNDVTTGNEVWRFTYVPTGKNFTQDISSSHWSANGNRVAFASNRKNIFKPAATASEYTWFLANTDGSKLRPGYQLSCGDWNWSTYPAFSPTISDVIYLPGDGRTGKNLNTLYKNTISDVSVSYIPVVSIDNTITRRIHLKKGVAGDGSKLLFRDLNNSRMYVVNLLSSSLETPTKGYDASLNWDTYWGDTASPNPAWHDNYVAGALGALNGIWNYHLGSGTHTWWRARLTGTGVDSAPTHTQDRTGSNLWGGELEPVNASYVGNDPFGGVEYVSHFTMDRWGKFGIHTKSNTSPFGTSLLDVSTHNYWSSAKAFSGAGTQWVQHHDWEAWSDWSVSSGGTQMILDYSEYRLLTQNYLNPTSQKAIAFTHTRINGTPAIPVYESVPRPTQSPDGTKVMFNSTFLNVLDDDVQMFWAVAYYPYPPEIKSATKSASNVRLVWDFNQASLGSPNFTSARTYATRGWPHEINDLPPSPREIDKFRVWISLDNTTWMPLGTTTYNNCRGTNECGKWAETSWSYDYAQPVSTTRFYAVTTLEYSGLESHSLGNVWKVTLDASGAVTEQLQQTAYPTSPGDKTAFFTTTPMAPRNARFAYLEAPATASGQYTIHWDSPADATMIRYYNIYAKDGAVPITNSDSIANRQKRRIASIPATSDYSGNGTFTYIDWLGSADGSTKYVVTAVDYQGNETADVETPITTINPPGGNYQTNTKTITMSVNEAATIYYTLDGSTPTTGSAVYTAPITINSSCTLKFFAVDTTGNTEWVRSEIYILDTTPPNVVSFSIPVFLNSYTVPITTFTASDTGSGVAAYLITENSIAPSAGATGWSASAPSTYTFSSAGSKILYAWAKDAAGNVSASTSRPVTVDLTAPVATLAIPAFYNSLTVPISTFTASDVGGSGVAAYMVTETASAPSAGAAAWSLSAPANYTFASAGSKTLYAWAKDAADNVSAGTSRPVTVDLTAPVATLSVPIFYNSLTVPIATFTASDTGGSGVAAYMVTETASAPSAGAAGWSTSAPANYTFASAGSKTLYAWAKDAAGNVSVNTSRPVTVDLTAPVATLAVPAFYNSLTVPIATFTASDTGGSGVAAYMVTETSSAPSAGAAAWSLSAPASYTFASAGSKTLYAWAKDAAGNVSASTSRPVTVDLILPTVTFGVPALSYTQAVPISTFTASDNIGVTGYLVTETSVTPAVSNAGWRSTAPANFIFSNPGGKTLYAWAKDAAGNVSSIKSAPVDVALPGDIDNKGTVDTPEALKALRFALGFIVPTPEQFVRADVAPLNMITHLPQPDGRIDIDDVILIMRKSVNLAW